MEWISLMKRSMVKQTKGTSAGLKSVPKKNKGSDKEYIEDTSNNTKDGNQLEINRDESEWPFECQLCKLQLQSKSQLNKHYMSKRHQKYPRLNPQKN